MWFGRRTRPRRALRLAPCMHAPGPLLAGFGRRPCFLGSSEGGPLGRRSALFSPPLCRRRRCRVIYPRPLVGRPDETKARRNAPSAVVGRPPRNCSSSPRVQQKLALLWERKQKPRPILGGPLEGAAREAGSSMGTSNRLFFFSFSFFFYAHFRFPLTFSTSSCLRVLGAVILSTGSAAGWFNCACAKRSEMCPNLIEMKGT